MARRRPIILASALTGARYSRDASSPNFHGANVPITPEETVADASEAYRAGARFLHIHARNPASGQQYADLGWYRAVAAGVRVACPGVLVGFPTSRKGEVGRQIEARCEQARRSSPDGRVGARQRVDAELLRGIGVEACPDTITTFTASEIAMTSGSAAGGGDGAERWADPQLIREYYRSFTAKVSRFGVGQELELTTWRAFDVIEEVAADAALNFRGPVHVVILLGFSAALPIHRDVYEGSLARLDRFRRLTGLRLAVSVGGVIRPNEAAPGPLPRRHGGRLPEGTHDYREIIEWVLADDRVDAIRVGLEDTPLLYDRQRTNADLVRQAREICEELGGRVETDPARVRATFGLGDAKAPATGEGLSCASR